MFFVLLYKIVRDFWLSVKISITTSKTLAEVLDKVTLQAFIFKLKSLDGIRLFYYTPTNVRGATVNKSITVNSIYNHLSLDYLQANKYTYQNREKILCLPLSYPYNLQDYKQNNTKIKSQKFKYVHKHYPVSSSFQQVYLQFCFDYYTFIF